MDEARRVLFQKAPRVQDGRWRWGDGLAMSRKRPRRLCAALALALALGPAAAGAILAAPAGAACIDPHALLEQVRAATGGAAWGSVRTLHRRGKLSTGGRRGVVDSFEDNLTGRFVREVSLPTGRQSDGFDGVSVWTQPATVPPYVYGDADSRLGAVNDSFRAARGWWFPERRPSSSECAGSRREGARAFDLVRMTPEAGRPFTLWVDRATHLIDRDVEQQAEQVSVIRYIDYRPVNGLLLPFTIRRGGETTTDETETVETVEVNPLVADARFSIPPAPAPTAVASVTVPMQLENGKVLVGVTVNGAGPFSAEFDTGGGLLLPPSLLKQLGLVAGGTLRETGGAEGSVPASEGIVDSIGIGAAVIEHPRFDSFEWAAYGSRRLLVGLEVLQRFVVRLDFDAMTMTLTRPDAFDYRGAGAIVPFHFQDNQPEVFGAVDGIAGLFTVDTGASGSLLLLAPFARRFGLAERYQAIFPYGDASSNTTYGVYGRAGEVALDGADGRPVVRVSRPITQISLQKGGFDADRYVSGNIEIGILKQFNVTFDYSRRRIIFEPNHHFGEPDVFNRSGMVLEAARGGWRVVFVGAGGPAERAGVRMGDEVLAIDGKLAVGLTSPAIRAIMVAPVGTGVGLTLRSGGRDRYVTLTLRDVL